MSSLIKGSANWMGDTPKTKTETKSGILEIIWRKYNQKK